MIRPQADGSTSVSSYLTITCLEKHLISYMHIASTNRHIFLYKQRNIMYKARRIYKTTKVVKNFLQIAFHKVYKSSPNSTTQTMEGFLNGVWGFSTWMSAYQRWELTKYIWWRNGWRSLRGPQRPVPLKDAAPDRHASYTARGLCEACFCSNAPTRNNFFSPHHHSILVINKKHYSKSPEENTLP